MNDVIDNTTPGDKVEIVSKDKTLKGTVMPGEPGVVVIKLSSGYNIGINKNNIRSIKLIEKHKEVKQKKNKISKNQKLPTISLLHTGGTIASKVDYRTGGVVSRFEPEEILDMFPELRDIANIDSRLIDNMWSEDMRFSHMQRIAKEVVKELEKKPKGIIVTLGTDFLAVVSAGVSLMLQNIPVPVILVGAQRSSDRGSSDAAMNLVCASEFITQTNFKGVAICMHETQNDISCLILPACKTRKMHSSRRDAFRPINTEAIARVSYENRKIVWLNDDYKEQKTGNFKPLLEMEDKVGLIKVHPNMMPSQFACFKGYKGLVIEGTGLGQMPTGVPNKEAKIHEKIFEEIKGLIKSGCVVVMTTQCIYGAVNMNVYSKGRDLMDVGIFQAKCLPETALVKLSWLLGNFTKDMKDRKKAQKLIEKEFADEMFYRVEDNAFLI